MSAGLPGWAGGKPDPKGPMVPTSEELIEAYFDGLLSPEEEAAFERAAVGDARLGEVLKLGRAIEDSLRSQYTPPASIALNLPPPSAEERRRIAEAGPIPISRGTAPARTWTISRLVLAAAAVLVFSFAGLWAVGVVSPYGLLGITPPGLISPEEVFQRKVATGFRPDWVCQTDAQFEDVARQAFAQALQLPKDPGVHVVGWSYYEPILSEKTHLLLTQVDGKNAIVVIDCQDKARRLSASTGTGLHVYSRTFDNVVLYQVSEEGTRNILPMIYNPDHGVKGSCDSANRSAPPPNPGG
ncbi:MAG: hypothetical protein AB7G11_09255 [Phycisphaerales bacterium]